MSICNILSPRPNSEVPAKFDDGSAALVPKIGKGMLYSAGILPALDTLLPLERVGFNVRSQRAIARIETIHHRAIDFKTDGHGVVSFSLPLDASDYIKVIDQ